MGESKRRVEVAKREVVEALGLETAGGRLQVRWDESAQATPHGQMAFFIEFLTVSGLFEDWIRGYPLQYKSPHSSPVRDVLGTWGDVDPIGALALRPCHGAPVSPLSGYMSPQVDQITVNGREGEY